MRTNSSLLVIAVAGIIQLLAACGERQTSDLITVIHAPSVTSYVTRDPNGTTITSIYDELDRAVFRND